MWSYGTDPNELRCKLTKHNTDSNTAAVRQIATARKRYNEAGGHYHGERGTGCPGGAGCPGGTGCSGGTGCRGPRPRTPESTPPDVARFVART